VLPKKGAHMMEQVTKPAEPVFQITSMGGSGHNGELARYVS
jgi:hypothetical protein